KIRINVPVGGRFFDQSNWVDLAASHDAAAGIQSDGSLWKILSRPTNSWRWTNWITAVPRPERLGTDSDWKVLAAGSGHFLALKADGSLWGWRGNWNGELGPRQKEFVDDPVRIGVDSDWAAVFATGA